MTDPAKPSPLAETQSETWPGGLVVLGVPECLQLCRHNGFWGVLWADGLQGTGSHRLPTYPRQHPGLLHGLLGVSAPGGSTHHKTATQFRPGSGVTTCKGCCTHYSTCATKVLLQARHWRVAQVSRIALQAEVICTCSQHLLITKCRTALLVLPQLAHVLLIRIPHCDASPDINC